MQMDNPPRGLDALSHRIDAAALQNRWDRVGEEVQRFVGHTHVVLGRQSDEIDLRYFSGFGAADIALIRAGFAKDARDHAEAIARQRDGISTGRLSERLSSAVADPLHKHLHVAHGLRHALSASLVKDGDGLFMIGVMTPSDAPRPGAEDNAHFRALVQRLRRAVSVMAVVERNAALTRGLEAAFDEVAVGLILCDAEGRTIHINAAAANLVAAWDGMRTGRDALRFLDPSAQATARDEIARAAAGAPGRGGAFQAQRRGGAPPLIVTVAGFGSGMAAVFLEDPARMLLPDSERLAEATELSRAQASAALLAAEGMSTAAMAARLGVSENTARTHLRRAFAKLDCSDRRELMVRLAALTGALR